jgi:hypothetical protein
MAVDELDPDDEEEPEDDDEALEPLLQLPSTVEHGVGGKASG